MFLDIFSSLKAAKRSYPGSTVALGLPLALSIAAAALTLSISSAAGWTSSGATGGVEASDYASLKALYDRSRFDDVARGCQKLLLKVRKGDGDYDRIQVLLTLVAFKTRPLFVAADQAKLAFADAPGNAVAASNYAVLQLALNDRELAGQLFEKAAQIAPDDFLCHVGLAEVFAGAPKSGSAIAELAKAEAAGNTFGLSTGQKWLIIGDAYMVLREPSRALAAYLNAEKVEKPSGRSSQAVYLAALASGQIDLAHKRLPEALAGRAVGAEVFVRTAANFCPSTAEGNKLARQVYEQASASSVAEADFYYSLGRAFARSGQDQYARLCFQGAYYGAPLWGQYAVAYAAALAKTGNAVDAYKILTPLGRADRVELLPQAIIDRGLARAGLSMLRDYDSDWASALKKSLKSRHTPIYKTAYASLTNIKCRCRLMALQRTLATQPGVIFAYVPNDQAATALVIYDSRQNQPGAIWDKIKGEATPSPLAREETMHDFAQLAQTAQDYAEAPYRPLQPILNFALLPLRPL